jgi:hypothetical protein
MVLPGHSEMDVQGRPQGELITPDLTSDARRTPLSICIVCQSALSTPSPSIAYALPPICVVIPPHVPGCVPPLTTFVLSSVHPLSLRRLRRQCLQVCRGEQSKEEQRGTKNVGSMNPFFTSRENRAGDPRIFSATP